MKELSYGRTLVALYDTVTDAERVVQELLADGFARSDIHLALDHTTGRKAQSSAVEWDAAYEGERLIDTLADLGVPSDEAYFYAEGVRRSGALVVLESSEERAERGLEILQRLQPVNIHARSTQWRQEGWTGAEAHARTATATTTATSSTPMRDRASQRGDGDKEITIPVVEEELAIGTRAVERSHVRIYSRVTEQPVEQQVCLREEKVTVERRPVDRPATDTDLAAAKEIIEMTETAEEPVINKRVRVVEEVVVQKEVTERTETIRGTARHTDVEVQREPEPSTETRRGMTPQDFGAYDPMFRKHYASTFAGTSAASTEYEPAYRYGYELGTHARYRGRDWAALEADTRHDWEARHPNTWERFKDAIRYGWDTVRART